MHIWVGKLTIIGSDNGLSPGRRQAIIWTNAGILLIEPLGTNFSEILIGIQIFSFKKMRLKMASAKWRPFCLGLNVLNMICATVPAKWGTHNVSEVVLPARVNSSAQFPQARVYSGTDFRSHGSKFDWVSVAKGIMIFSSQNCFISGYVGDIYYCQGYDSDPFSVNKGKILALKSL